MNQKVRVAVAELDSLLADTYSETEVWDQIDILIDYIKEIEQLLKEELSI